MLSLQMGCMECRCRALCGAKSQSQVRIPDLAFFIVEVIVVKSFFRLFPCGSYGAGGTGLLGEGGAVPRKAHRTSIKSQLL